MTQQIIILIEYLIKDQLMSFINDLFLLILGVLSNFIIKLVLPKTLQLEFLTINR